MGDVIKGPWANKATETITKVYSSGNYKVMDFFEAADRQERAYESEVFMVLYVIGLNYNKTFLVPGKKEDVEYQMHVRRDRPEEIDKIKAALGWNL